MTGLLGPQLTVAMTTTVLLVGVFLAPPTYPAPSLMPLHIARWHL